MKKVALIGNAEPTSLNHTFYCPGCKCHHGFKTSPPPGPQWTFNGDFDKPTVRPSILVTSVELPSEDKSTWERNPDGSFKLDNRGRIFGTKDVRCHLYITDGKIQYLSDCTHSLAGKTVEMELF